MRRERRVGRGMVVVLLRGTEGKVVVGGGGEEIGGEVRGGEERGEVLEGEGEEEEGFPARYAWSPTCLL